MKCWIQGRWRSMKSPGGKIAYGTCRGAAWLSCRSGFRRSSSRWCTTRTLDIMAAYTEKWNSRTPHRMPEINWYQCPHLSLPYYTPPILPNFPSQHRPSACDIFVDNVEFWKCPLMFKSGCFLNYLCCFLVTYLSFFNKTLCNILHVFSP